MQAEDNILPLSIRRTRRANRRLPKRFRDVLPEPPLPLPPHGAEVLLEVNALEADPGSCPSTSAAFVTMNSQSSSLEVPVAQPAQLPLKQCGIVVTPKNSFGMFRLYDEGSIPSADDPEDQSGAGPITTPEHEACASQPLPSFVNAFYPYPNESSWQIGDWYWNDGAQKSKQSLKKLTEIITSDSFRPEDLYRTNWVAIDRQLGSLEAVPDSSQGAPMVTDSEEWQASDGGWMRRTITISVPFPRRFLHPGPRNYTISNFYRRSLLSIIRETLSDPTRCRSFRFEPYSLRWRHSGEVDDVGIYDELYSSQAFIAAHRDLQGAQLDSISCTLPRRIVALMFWSDATQLTVFRDTKLWPLYVYFGNESKYQRCVPTANLCSHAAYFQTVCNPCFAVVHI